MKIVILWTDYFVYLLLAAAITFILTIRRQEHLAEPWKQVFMDSKATVAAVVLLFFVLMGALDSFHFRKALEAEGSNGETYYATFVSSGLDVILSPLNSNLEKSYSAPFATTLYSKDAVQQSDGSQTRIYLPLRFAGTHLHDGESVFSDVIHLAWAGALKGLFISALVGFIVIATLARRAKQSLAQMFRSIARNKTRICWRATLLTATTVIVLVNIISAWMPYYHVLGTDKVGHDVLYIALKSIRTGLVIGSLTTLVMLPFAVSLGLFAGFIGRWVDSVIAFIYTTISSIPGVLLIAAATLSLQVFMGRHADWFTTGAERADVRLFALCAILGLTGWTGLCRTLRGEGMKIREIEYVQAAKAFGVKDRWILFRHVLPNVMHIVLITITLDFSGLVLAEAVLSYVGVGVDPSSYSWGNMINSARLEMAREPIVWWTLLAAFSFMVTLVLAANIFSDGVREAFEPRSQKKWMART